MEQITKEELLDVTGKFELGNHIEIVSVEPMEADISTIRSVLK